MSVLISFVSKIEDINVEEILHDSESGQRALELALTRNVFYGFYAVTLIFVGLFLVRILTLGMVRGDFYVKRALANVNKEIYIPAERGMIFDRFHNVLAGDSPSFSVSIKLSEFLKNQDAIRSYLKESIGLTDQDIDKAIQQANVEESDLVIVTSDLSKSDIVKLKAKDIPGLYIEDNFIRNYPYNDAFSHVVGYVDTENIGRTGLESSYDSRLQGVSGALIRQYNANGELLDHKELRQSSAGTDLTTTLDADFQIYFKNRLQQGLNDLGRTGGVGIAIDPRNGEVLSLVSLPTFDANILSHRSSDSTSKSKKAEMLISNSKPLFDRALSGVYNPGSTVKPLVAVAALAENIIAPAKKILSKGYMEIPNPYNPDKPSRFLDWTVNGWVDLRAALARSSNIYFYAVGGGFPSGGGLGVGADSEKMAGLGIDRLIKWWQTFGFGEKTNIDLLDENDGFLPNPQEKELRTGTQWRIGDTYNVSIGQGDLLITPLQLVNYIGAIANGGTLYQPHLNKALEPKILRSITDLENQFKEVQAGMRDAVVMPYGTAHRLNDLPMTSAAKTGTAQIQNNAKTNAFTVAFAPYESPQIAIIVLVEDSREGSLNTVPIARDVLEWYYWNRIASQKNASSTYMSSSLIRSSGTVFGSIPTTSTKTIRTP